jgi:hypothetical protein
MCLSQRCRGELCTGYEPASAGGMPGPVAEQVLSSNYPSCEKIRPATGAVEFAIFPPMHIVSGLVGDHDVDAPRLRSAAVIARLAG